MTCKTLGKIGKKFLKRYKKHKVSIDLILSVLFIILALLPFIVEERIVLIQRIRVIELPPINEYQTTAQETLRITDSVYAIVERANGTVEYIQAP